MIKLSRESSERLVLLQLAMAPDAQVGNSEIRRQDQAHRNAVKTGRIVRSDDLVFLTEDGSIRTYMLAGASRIRAYEGKRVRI